MFGKAGDLIVGGGIALGVGLLGWMDIATAPTPDDADASIREFGTLLTVLFGLAAAIWWNQSAKISNELVDADVPARQSQRDANTLNGAAATFTAASLLCSVFAGSPWKSTGSWLSAVNLLLLLTMSGSDLQQAVRDLVRAAPWTEGGTSSRVARDSGCGISSASGDMRSHLLLSRWSVRSLGPRSPMRAARTR